MSEIISISERGLTNRAGVLAVDSFRSSKRFKATFLLAPLTKKITFRAELNTGAVRVMRSNPFPSPIVTQLSCTFGAVVPGKYLRGTPISLNETERIISSTPISLPVLCGGWAIRGWRHQGWTPLRKNLFLALWDTDASLDYYLDNISYKLFKYTIKEENRYDRINDIATLFL